ncbi:uncharacterized protein PRCAT00005577001 [Priceomyces carsonii]|uniref:uncharacterized protein n=1 Tax=Priceomyces carsonii TaxID=28549 RepID=UPI002EDAB9F7|nr:unnamed protein product [Priceomyces carsonii]
MSAVAIKGGIWSRSPQRATFKLLIKLLNDRIGKPTLKAFLIAYLYVTLPRVLNCVIVSLRKKKYNKIPQRLYNILTRALHSKKFPMLSAFLVGGINILEPIVYYVIKRSGLSSSPINSLFFSTFISSFVSALIAFPRYQGHILGYGRNWSLDLTLLVVTRALDTALSSSLGMIAPKGIAGYGDACLFIVSCSFIMFSWFYRPHSLPPAYCKWITSAANMDVEILAALKGLHEGTIKYGTPSLVLEQYCLRHKVDPSEGNFVKNQPMKCNLVHAFKTNSCEVHALWRFLRGFSFAMKIYGPLNALMLLVPIKNAKMKSRIIRSIKSTFRSSFFLGAFIGLYWYAVCLARLRIFPKLFPSVPKTRWDITVGPAAGSVLCGFSSFIESAQRRKELALFVAPRALGTIVPSEASERNLNIETFAFALSLAILVAYSRRDPRKVRGIFGRGLQQVFNRSYYK